MGGEKPRGPDCLLSHTYTQHTSHTYIHTYTSHPPCQELRAAEAQLRAKLTASRDKELEELIGQLSQHTAEYVREMKER
ncbi:MAG TPA: hypothetical protein V6C97_21905 [Oculatellaceae cyanobacterium]